MNFKNVTVAGSGVLGYQIAFQTAFHGFKVSVYDINDDVLAKAKAKFFELSECYKHDLNATQEQLDNTFNNLSYCSNLAEAVKDADLVIEAVPEDVGIKTEFYKQLSQVAPEKTVFATNTSTMLPSQFKDLTGRQKNLWFYTLPIKSGSITWQKLWDMLKRIKKCSIIWLSLPKPLVCWLYQFIKNNLVTFSTQC